MANKSIAEKKECNRLMIIPIVTLWRYLPAIVKIRFMVSALHSPLFRSEVNHCLVPQPLIKSTNFLIIALCSFSYNLSLIYNNNRI